jgi:hypothetical protein
MEEDDRMNGTVSGAIEHPTIKAKREEESPPPLARLLEEEDDGEEELEEDSADELPDDIDPNAGVAFFRIGEADRVQDQRVTPRTVRELFGAPNSLKY